MGISVHWIKVNMQASMVILTLPSMGLGASKAQGALCRRPSHLPHTFPFVRPWPAEEEENTASAESFGEKPSLVVSVPLSRSNQVHFAGSERPELWQETKLA